MAFKRMPLLQPKSDDIIPWLSISLWTTSSLTVKSSLQRDQQALLIWPAIWLLPLTTVILLPALRPQCLPWRYQRPSTSIYLKCSSSKNSMIHSFTFFRPLLNVCLPERRPLTIPYKKPPSPNPRPYSPHPPYPAHFFLHTTAACHMTYLPMTISPPQEWMWVPWEWAFSLFIAISQECDWHLLWFVARMSWGLRKIEKFTSAAAGICVLISKRAKPVDRGRVLPRADDTAGSPVIYRCIQT